MVAEGSVTEAGRSISQIGTSARGFSLIELMMVVVLMAILLVVAVPGMRRLIVDNRINAAVGDLANGLGFARTEAVRINASVLFCASDVHKHWGVAHKVVVDESAEGSAFSSTSIREGRLPDEVQLLAEGLSVEVDDYHCVRMRPEGLAYVGVDVVGSGARLTVKHDGRARSLAVSPGGVNVDPHVLDSE